MNAVLAGFQDSTLVSATPSIDRERSLTDQSSAAWMVGEHAAHSTISQPTRPANRNHRSWGIDRISHSRVE
jgi:hypothetical protein